MTSHNPLTRGKKQKALALLQAGNLGEARALLDKVCATDRRDTEAWYLLGTIYEREEAPGEAERCYRRAAELEPERAVIHYALGNAQHALGRLSDAVESYRKTLAISDNFIEAWCNLAATFESLGRMEEAAQSYEHALAHDPTRAEIHYNLANVQRALGRHDNAIHGYREAIRRHPEFAAAWDNLGLALTVAALDDAHDGQRLNLLEEAVVARRQALQLQPDAADIHNNLAVTLRHLGRLAEAAESYRRALALDPTHTDAHEGLATVELLLGQFAEGWVHYRHRVSMRTDNAPPPNLPTDLAGKRLLVVRDQGLGDELFFLRFAPHLKKRGAYLMYRPNPKLTSILARAPVIDQLLGPDEVVPADFILSIGDLPWLLDMRHCTQIPAALALAPLPKLLQETQHRLANLGAPPYIGVTWRAGNKTMAHVLYKECPLTPIAHMLKDVPGTVIVLQRLPTDGEIDAFSRALGRPAHDLSALNDDLESILALLSLIDEYVGVSNTNMHLRAGVGKTARVLVPSPPEWRWMAEGKESPWFPGFTVYRQGYDGDWGGTFGELADDLRSSAEGRALA